MATNTDKNFENIDKRFDEVLGAMSQFAESVDKRFDGVDKRFDSIETRLDRLGTEFIDLKESQNRLMNTIDGFISRIDKYETELAARDHEIERLKRWIKEIADKTGVELSIS